MKQDIAKNSSQSKENKSNEERVGDWVCLECANLNFSFRSQCNRCLRNRTESASVLTDVSEL